LIGSCQAAAEQKTAMLLAASEGQRQLCRGQGAELCWARHPAPLTSLQVLEIFRQKTAPAFEVALRLGALYAGTDEHDEVSDVLQAYSEALGIAYQIRDDLSDLGAKGDTNDIAAMRPSLLLAVAYERAAGDSKTRLEELWRRSLNGLNAEQIEALYVELKTDERARTLLETYKEEAIRSLRDLDNPNLKGLLRRVIGKIFNDTEIKGWCKEFEQKNAAQRSDLPVLPLVSA
jgi:geranylgeranyl pyrophosphate synthase